MRPPAHHPPRPQGGRRSPEELERTLAGAPALEVTLLTDGERGRALLAPLPGLAALTPLPSREEGSVRFRLEPQEGVDLRLAVFSACAQQQVPLLELRRDAMTLEQMFLKLTSDDQAQDAGEEEGT